MIKSGFVYLWKDTKRNKFYLGSHGGTIDDGYTGSNKRFKNAYKSRPGTFRRRILEYYEVCTNSFIREREQYWLSLIKQGELNLKYYNVKNLATGGDIFSLLSKEEQELIRLKSSSRIRNLLDKGFEISVAQEIIKEEDLKINLSKRLPGETWKGRQHTKESKAKMSSYRLKNPSKRENFNHTDESKFKVKINNPKRQSINTPYGSFLSAEDFCKKFPIITSNGLRLLFKDLDCIITKRRAERCSLISINDIGKTLREIGYSYIQDTDVN